MGGVCSPVFVPGGPQHFVGLHQENSLQKVLAEILLHSSQVYFVSRKSFLLSCSFSFATRCLYVKPFFEGFTYLFFWEKESSRERNKGRKTSTHDAELRARCQAWSHDPEILTRPKSRVSRLAAPPLLSLFLKCWMALVCLLTHHHGVCILFLFFLLLLLFCFVECSKSSTGCFRATAL